MRKTRAEKEDARGCGKNGRKRRNVEVAGRIWAPDRAVFDTRCLTAFGRAPNDPLNPVGRPNRTLFDARCLTANDPVISVPRAKIPAVQVPGARVFNHTSAGHQPRSIPPNSVQRGRELTWQRSGSNGALPAHRYSRRDGHGSIPRE